MEDQRRIFIDMRRITVITLFALVASIAGSSACKSRDSRNIGTNATSGTAKVADTPPQRRPETNRTAVSIVQLLANPGYYDGHDASVAGFLVFEDLEDDAVQGQLHLNREDAQLMLGTHIDISAGACGEGEDKRLLVGMARLIGNSGRYVRIYGKFFSPVGSARPRGIACSITNVFAVSEPSQPAGKLPSEKDPVSKSVPSQRRR